MEKLFENLGLMKKPKGGLQHPRLTPRCKGQHANIQWVLAYSHKTQFFMKNEGQQKCLDKTL